MMIYSKANQYSIERAIAKARKVKPKVLPVKGTFGKFQVASSTPGKNYQVQFTKDPTHGFVVLCECQGNVEGYACYHGAAAAPFYKQQVAERAAERVALDAQHEEIFGTPRRHDPSEDNGFDGCMVRGCGKPVEQPQDLFCLDHALEIGMNRNEVEGAVA